MTEEPVTLQPPPRLESGAITDLARKVVTNQVFATNNPEGIKCAFGMITMLRGIPPETGLLWEELSKAGPRSLNGYPMFFSCHLLHIEDLPLLVSECRRMSEALGVSFDGRSSQD